MIQTPAALHKELTDFGVQTYHDIFIDLFVREAQKGEIPGIENPNPDQLRAFFDQMPPEQWTQLAAQNPSQAATMLNEYKKVSHEPQ